MLDGLTRPFKELPPKHFYDERGSELFERICELPEYYPTRTERAILEAESARDRRRPRRGRGRRARARAPRRRRGSCSTRCAAAGHARALRPGRRLRGDDRARADELTATYEGLDVHGIVGDFERHLEQVPRRTAPRIVAFLGGTIGNFTPGARRLPALARAAAATRRSTTSCSAPTSSRTRGS